MKYLYSLLVFMAVGVCRGQPPVLPILQEAKGIVEGAYYKDLDNELGKFVSLQNYKTTNNNVLKSILQ